MILDKNSLVFSQDILDKIDSVITNQLQHKDYTHLIHQQAQKRPFFYCRIYGKLVWNTDNQLCVLRVRQT